MTRQWGYRKGIALGAEFGENVNRRNWWSLLGGHRNWAIWEISFGRRTDLPPNSKAQERRQRYVRQEYGLLARSFCRASFCLHSEARAVAPRLAGGAQQGTLPRATLGEIRAKSDCLVLGRGFQRTNAFMDHCASCGQTAVWLQPIHFHSS